MFIGATGQVVDKILPFRGGEQLDYVGYYNFKKVWVPAGKVTFSVTDTVYESTSCFHLKGAGRSFKEYDVLFKVRDVYESVISKHDLLPRRFLRDVSEGGFEIFYDYKFDRNQLVTWVTNGEGLIDTIPIQPTTMDIMSAVYQVRTLDFSKSKVGDTVGLNLILDKRKYRIYVRYLGKGVAKSLKREKFNCIKLSPLLVEGTVFNSGEHMIIYVTDDKNRIPVFVSADILIGTIKVYLEKYQGVKYPYDQ